jgi:hypothetical protein
MAQKKTKAAAANGGASVYIYLGPTIRGVIQNAAIYTGTLNEVRAHLKDALDAQPDIGVLLIPAAQAGEVRAALKRGGNAYAFCYKKLSKNEP